MVLSFTLEGETHERNIGCCGSGFSDRRIRCVSGGSGLWRSVAGVRRGIPQNRFAPLNDRVLEHGQPILSMAPLSRMLPNIADSLGQCHDTPFPLLDFPTLLREL